MNTPREATRSFWLSCLALLASFFFFLLLWWIKVVCYPNSGEVWHGDTRTWSEAPAGPDAWLEDMRRARDAGATILGGCCRVHPPDVQRLSNQLHA